MLAYAFPRTAHFEIIYVIVICAPINYINMCAKPSTVDSLLLLAVPVNKSLLRAWSVWTHANAWDDCYQEPCKQKECNRNLHGPGYMCDVHRKHRG